MQYVKTTEGVTIEVQVTFLPQQSTPMRSAFAHIYNISIHNHRSSPIQLLRRHWIVQDADGRRNLVEGDGVIGQQPVIEPGGHYHYSSWTHVSTPLGQMKGAYTMINLDNEILFQVEVPAFLLIYPPLLN